MRRMIVVSLTMLLLTALQVGAKPLQNTASRMNGSGIVSPNDVPVRGEVQRHHHHHPRHPHHPHRPHR